MMKRIRLAQIIEELKELRENPPSALSEMDITVDEALEMARALSMVHDDRVRRRRLKRARARRS